MLKLEEGLRHEYRAYYEMAWAEFDAQGNCVMENKPNPIMGKFPEELKETVKEMIAKLPKKPFNEDVYIRFSKIPKSGVSTNWASKTEEAGLSVYDTIYNLETGTYDIYGALPGAAIAYLIKEAPIYFVTGKEVGRGADGEPLLAEVKVLGKAKYTEGGYVVK